MANCPKCNTRLKITQWRPECPSCGVNMVYYKANDRLLQESEQAEIEHALFQPKIDRAKAAFFGSPQAIIRIVLTVVPLGALFLPLVHVIYPDHLSDASLLTIFTSIKETGFPVMIKKGLYGGHISLAVILLLLSAFMLLIILFCIAASLGKHGKKRTAILHILQTGSAFSSAAVIVFSGGKSAVDAFQIKLCYGAYIYLFFCSFLFLWNLFLIRKGLPVKKTVCHIGGLPSDEYFEMTKAGQSELTVKNRMIKALTLMQEEVRAKAAMEEKKAAAARAARK